MPICFLEAPSGIQSDAKAKLAQQITAALDEAYHVGDVRFFLREYPAGNAGQDGRFRAEPVRPVCFLEAPQLWSMDARKILIERINAAITEAYRGIANTEEIMILLNEYPLENVGWAGRLQSDNPDIVAAMQALRDKATA